MSSFGETSLRKLLNLIKANFFNKTTDSQSVTTVDLETTDTIDIDSTPTANSTNLVTSGGVYSAVSAKGTYSKPVDGIPASDLASAVQTSLGKADTAIQSHQDISGKVDKPTAQTPVNYVPTSDGQGGYAWQAQQGGGGSSVWGSITGSIGNQTDLAEKLSEKQFIPDELTPADGTFTSLNETVYDARYMHKQVSAVSGNLAKFDASGTAVDSSIASNTLLFGDDGDVLVKILSGVQKIALTEGE